MFCLNLYKIKDNILLGNSSATYQASIFRYSNIWAGLISPSEITK